jgi:hypothetical protein
MRHLEIEVTNAAELLDTEAYGSGALLRWESSPAPLTAYTEGGTEALVSGTTLYDVWDAAGIATTWYRTRVSNAAGTTFSAYSAPLPPVTSLTSLAEVRALVKSRLTDIDLQAVIDREEAWLTGKVGPLTGERTDTWTPGLGDTPLYLSRRAPSVVLTDAGRTLAASEFLFTPSTGMIRRIWTPDLADNPPWRQLYLGWEGTVSATWTPSDEADVKRAVIELVRLSTGETGFASETIGDYSYARATSAGAYAGPNRAGLARSILLRRPAYSMRIHSAMEAS